MRNKKIVLWVGIALCALLVGVFFFVSQRSVIRDYKDVVEGGNLQSSDILVMLPKTNDSISNPIEVSGMVKGNWFFEGSFPIRIYNEKGALLGLGLAGTKEDWMTENMIPFFASISFENPGSGLGWIRLEKDNPSDIREFDASHDIPVRFVSDKMQVKVYFHNKVKANDPNLINCGKVFPVLRMIEKTQAVGRASIEQLLLGPTEQEKRDGYFTTITVGEDFSTRVNIKNIKIENGTATVDFDRGLAPQGGSCALAAVLSQVRETLLQFPTVSEVNILVNGSSEWSENP